MSLTTLIILFVISSWGLLNFKTLIKSSLGRQHYWFRYILIWREATVVKTMAEAIWKRMLISLWAVTLALLTSQAFGLTHICSSLFDEQHITLAADIIFLLLSAIYAVLLSRFVSNVFSFPFNIMALLPLYLILWFLLFY
ncbi:MAG: hypothetical protein JSC189_000078 [Candidatus Tokpelaia sp. JSC189]|nr:MAG: hypothetical protein JSC189_000078 [Candidatus Tokpelaia sp. JSC189]